MSRTGDVCGFAVSAPQIDASSLSLSLSLPPLSLSLSLYASPALSFYRLLLLRTGIVNFTPCRDLRFAKRQRRIFTHMA